MRDGRARRLAGGANALLSLILLAGLLVAINYLGNRHHLRRDLTANRYYSLSGENRIADFEGARPVCDNK